MFIIFQQTLVQNCSHFQLPTNWSNRKVNFFGTPFMIISYPNVETKVGKMLQRLHWRRDRGPKVHVSYVYFNSKHEINFLVATHAPCIFHQRCSGNILTRQDDRRAKVQFYCIFHITHQVFLIFSTLEYICGTHKVYKRLQLPVNFTKSPELFFITNI